MSVQARQALVRSANTIFQHDSQRHDLLDSTATSTELIAALTYVCITKGHAVEFTAIRADHHPDGYLNPAAGHHHTHQAGDAADFWPLASARAGDYLDAEDPRFQTFLRDLAAAPFRYQIGLAGSADTAANRAAAGPSVFPDDGGDHIHFGAV